MGTIYKFAKCKRKKTQTNKLPEDLFSELFEEGRGNQGYSQPIIKMHKCHNTYIDGRGKKCLYKIILWRQKLPGLELSRHR